MGRLEGKVAIITGAAGGQGKAEAKLFVEEGARVVATDVNEDMLNETVNEIKNELGSDTILGLTHDVASEDEWKEVVNKAVETYDKVDILVNNAGIEGQAFDNQWEIELEDTKNILNINLIGNMLGAKYVVPVMKENGGGSIINISSIAGLVGGASGQSFAYSASKGGNRLFTKDLAMEVAEYNIRVNSVHPGMVKTAILDDIDEDYLKEMEEVIPLGFAAESIDLAYGVLFLAADESRFMTGTELIMDGGFTAN